MTKFTQFLKEIEENSYPTNVTSTGTITIQQSLRNELRKKGVAALKDDLAALYEGFDIVETKDGIIVVAENNDFTFSWEIKCTIKSLDFDPFVEASSYDEQQAEKLAKRQKREAEAAARSAALQERRERKLRELEERKGERIVE